MRVTLAYPYDGHKPDETVDLPDADARRLLWDGKARLPDPTHSARATNPPEAPSDGPSSLSKEN